jgi:hypothetical protein
MFASFDVFDTYHGRGLMRNLPFFQVLYTIEQPGKASLAFFFNALQC